ncbi:tetratricopeptide repeat protein 19 homolog, mitochondrial-like isoform X2 [Varroa jacobsoni]|uniref:Uncharacterized protein n=1 Tax=Varroa destructor TaxID=109461 RepID=A0A7M7K1A9_VARDE|nr:tetratricopeptide repeat protein 19 homolog, mitochondrial-like [Varroa destructor]XP_022708167.1 tetratricopeptide repeat protein 19 homolog, mitochondrial-like isoform X1 [Varroa jacobsoni]XP_022708172.1 tetratricopeptide repeat protein 19 homolog, mitochondrial-like isoform X1 [Varroa jacobsoni]XP_022708180.1 tetratricopeptide repeat protein 19 homolog, mitochondrial-like isoform X2 [Varroa jacobsoni]
MLVYALRSALRHRFGEVYIAAQKTFAGDCHYRSDQITVNRSADFQKKYVYHVQNGYGSSQTWQFIATPPLRLGGILAFLGLESKDKDEEDSVVTTIKRGILAFQRKDYKKAERMLHLALKMSQERMDTQAETYCFDLLADIALAHGDLDKAEKLYVEVMRRLIISGTAKDDNAIIEISAKLANVFSKRHDDKKAEQGYQFCIDTQEKKLGELIKNFNNVSFTPEEKNSVALWGMCMDWYSKHLISRGKYAYARSLLSQSLEVSRKIFGESHEQTLVVKNDLALVNTMLKDYKESIRILEEIIGLDSVEQSEDLPAFLCNLGENYIKNGDFDKAQECCERAKELAKKQNNEMAIEVAESCLGEIQQKRKESSRDKNATSNGRK